MSKPNTTPTTTDAREPFSDAIQALENAASIVRTLGIAIQYEDDDLSATAELAASMIVQAVEALEDYKPAGGAK